MKAALFYQAASARLLACREESSELAKTKDQLLKMRRVAKSQADQQELTEAELAEADMQRRTAQVELAKSQRLQREEVKRRHAVISEREAFKQEVETLKERLRSLEAQPVLPREGAWAPLTKSFSSQDNSPGNSPGKPGQWYGLHSHSSSKAVLRDCYPFSKAVLRDSYPFSSFLRDCYPF